VIEAVRGEHGGPRSLQEYHEAGRAAVAVQARLAFGDDHAEVAS